MNSKQDSRSEWQARRDAKPQANWGKASEKLRGLPSYRNAATVFATPHASLLQARINCLVDGKNLLMPTPGIREGFFLLAARSIPFRDISMAVTYKGLTKYGQRLKNSLFPQHVAGMLLTDSLVVDMEGGRIGDGDGYFDLCCALLHELACLRHDTDIATFVQDGQVSPGLLPQDKWDIKVNRAITPDRIWEFEGAGHRPQIYWDMLSLDRVRRIGPLWKLYNEGVEGLRSQGATGKK